MANEDEKRWQRTDEALPSPVLHIPGRTRFSQPNKLRVRWEKLKRRMGNGSAPDDSLGDPTTETSDTESALARTRTGSRSAFSEKDDGVVDTVVVENEGRYCQWKDGQVKVSTTGASDPLGTENTPPTFSGGLYHPSDFGSSRNTAFHDAGFFGKIGEWLRWSVWPRLHHFLFLRYHDEALEEAFLKERWWQQKNLHIFGGAFLILQWLLGLGLLPRPWSVYNMATWYGVVPFLSVPPSLMAAFDVPRRQPWFWQLWVFVLVIWFDILNIVDMRLCGYYLAGPLKKCGNKDFMATLFYSTGMPLLALFSLGMWRITAIAALAAWTIVVAGLVLPLRPAFARNLITVLVLQVFMLWVHYRRDAMDRRVYTLRAELKVQFRAKQKSQINERKASDSKRRLTSYIFHEVRVPLNTALLAVQNLEAANAFNKDSEQAIEYAALQGSLQMMSQVLNDVLDFSRMERGGFSSVSRPFALHGAMRSVFGPLKLDAQARGLSLETKLDPRIDDVARAAVRKNGSAAIEELDGVVMGDEMRLRQVINNLCSNACKFTPAGGKISVTTTLIYPTLEESDSVDKEFLDEKGGALTPSKLHQHDLEVGVDNEDDLMVVRFEVTDTGFGIHPRDMQEHRLFSPYIQSELGRRQGGKGTGLGLSLVRNIVMLSGGRLGVKSKLNSGSTFWIEMPFSIGRPVVNALEEVDKLHPLYSPPQGTIASSSGKSASTDLAYIPSLKHTASDSSVPHAMDTPAAAVEAAPVNFLFSTALPQSKSTRNMEQQATLHGIRADATPDELVRPPIKPNQQVHSAPTSVTVPAPVRDETRRPSAATLTSAPEESKQALNVLVVDDDMLTRRLMTRMMERLGCTVTTAENGQVALGLILAEKAQDPQRILYDVIFLDNQMPLVSGLQVAARLRGAERHDFIVGVTANAQIAEQEEYIERGANYVLTKPVLEADLKRMLKIAETRRAERQAQGQPDPADSSEKST